VAQIDLYDSSSSEDDTVEESPTKSSIAHKDSEATPGTSDAIQSMLMLSQRPLGADTDMNELADALTNNPIEKTINEASDIVLSFSKDTSAVNLAISNVGEVTGACVKVPDKMVALGHNSIYSDTVGSRRRVDAERALDPSTSRSSSEAREKSKRPQFSRAGAENKLKLKEMIAAGPLMPQLQRHSRDLFEIYCRGLKASFNENFDLLQKAISKVRVKASAKTKGCNRNGAMLGVLKPQCLKILTQ